MKWFFKRKKSNSPQSWAVPPCPQCRSTHTEVVTGYGADQSNFVRAWRGQRYITCRCRDCNRDFYADEPAGGVPEQSLTSSELVDDEEALRAAEEDLRKNIEEDDDRTCR